jgi:hypothetical protein
MVYTVLKCTLVKEDPKTGKKELNPDFGGYSKTHTITT